MQNAEKVLEMSKQDLLQKVVEIKQKTTALKAARGLEAVLQLLREIRELKEEVAAAKVTPCTQK